MDELIRKQDALDAAIKADMENHNGILSEKRARVFEEHISILPPVQMDDAISRQAAIYIASGYCHPANVANELAKLPSVQPKRGKWILDRSGAYYCSECMEPCASYVMMKPRDKFCKMCGADMRGEAE